MSRMPEQRYHDAELADLSARAGRTVLAVIWVGATPLLVTNDERADPGIAP